MKYTWNDIYDRADGASCGESTLKAKDNARYEVRCLMMNKFGMPDLEKEECPEDMVEYYCNNYSILFDEKGYIIDSIKTLNVNDCEVTFKSTTYADMFKRKAVLAYVVNGEYAGELYGDITINLPQYSLDVGESFLSADCPELIDAMVKNGYLKITGKVRVNYGTYQIGKFTKKFEDKFEKGE